jgi:2'-5' RNA ligase
MHLLAVITPPPEELDDLARLIASVGAPSRSGAGTGRRGLFGRRAQRDDTPSPTGELDAVPASLMRLPLSSFGNVTNTDARRLTAELAAAAAGWVRPTLRFAGGTALEFPGDTSVWATLEGDVEALGVVGNGVPEVVKRLGYFVDRRMFHPWLSVGTITGSTTAPYLEALVAALDAHRGQEWTVDHISVMRRPPAAHGPGTMEEVEQLPLAAS